MTEQLPPDAIAELTRMNPAITPELVAASWAVLKPFHEKTGYTAPKSAREPSYGDHQRHRLDVHTRGGESNVPVLVFVHGGGYVGGDKVIPGSPAHDHTGAGAVRNGWVEVTITYRLAPAAWFAKKSQVPNVVWSAGHNHISQIGSIGVDDLALGAQLARFVNRVTA